MSCASLLWAGPSPSRPEYTRINIRVSPKQWALKPALPHGGGEMGALPQPRPRPRAPPPPQDDEDVAEALCFKPSWGGTAAGGLGGRRARAAAARRASGGSDDDDEEALVIVRGAERGALD